MQLFIGTIQGGFAQINGDEHHHFTKVLRGQIGSDISITDGMGTIAKGKVIQITNKIVEVELFEIHTNYEKRFYKLHIAIAPTKNMERLEFFLEKATEIGIDEITFLNCFHSERRKINFERCSKIVQSASKQSIKAYLPQLNDLIKFNEFIKCATSETKLIAHCNEGYERTEFKKIIRPNENYLILIGPEGDFSKEEIELAYDNGFRGISIGNQRFRTETAALNTVFSLNWENS